MTFLVIYMIGVAILTMLYISAGALSVILESCFLEGVMIIIAAILMLWVEIGGGIILITILLKLPEVLK